MFTYEIDLRNEKGDVLRNFGGSFVTDSIMPYILVSDLINFAADSSERANKADNTASLPCLCEDCTRRTIGSCRPNTNSRVTACEGYTKSQQAVT